MKHRLKAIQFSHRITFLLIGFFFASSLLAQNNPSSFLEFQDEKRYHTLNKLYHDFSGDTPFIAELNKLVKKHGDKSDKLIQFYWTYKKPVIDSLGNSEKVIKIYRELVQKAENINNYYLVGFYYISISHNYQIRKLYNKAFENQLYCIDALEKDPNGRYFQQSWWLNMIATQLYQFKDYTKAISLAKIASSHDGYFTPDGVWFKKVNDNLVGMSYLKSGEYDSAYTWLKKTLDYAKSRNDKAWLGIATGNIGHVFYLQGKPESAIPYYTQAIEWCRKMAIWDNVASFCNNLADCYLSTGNYNKIQDLLRESEQANAKDRAQTGYVGNQIKLYTVAEAFYRKQGNNNLAIIYTDSIRKYQKLEEEYYNINKKIKAEGEFAYQSKELQNKLLLNENELQKRTLVFGLIALLLISGFVVFYIKRINLRKKLAEKNKEILEQQLAASKKEILDFTHHILEKNQLIENYTQEINSLKNQEQTDSPIKSDAIQELKSQTILTNDDWMKFKELFENIYPKFFPYLKSNYPDLTQAEVRFLAFTKLEITPKEMASLLGVSDEAIRTLRFRLKKKLGLSHGKEIEQVVMSI